MDELDWDYSVCCIKGCDEPTVALGLCNKHWRRNKAYGSPVAFKSHSGMFRGKSAEERFWVNISFEDDDCWLWHGGTDKDGYGIFKGDVEGKTYKRAHRFSYALHKGRIKKGLVVMHSCDTPGCVNPDHLSLGSNLDNMRDKIAKGRARVATGEDAGQAILTEEQVKEILLDPRPYTKLAAEYGVHTQTISSIKNQDSWKHIGLTPVKGNRESPRRGKSNKLNEEIVRIIRSSEAPQKDLAARYGVSVQTICDIRKRRSWAHVD